MKLTDRIILSCLENNFKIIYTAYIGASGKVQGPLFYDENQAPESGWIYIVSADDTLPESFPEGILLISAGERSKADCRVSQICVEEREAVRIHNVLMTCFFFYEEWEEQLTKIQIDFGGAEELLRASLPVFENPLVIFREDFRVKASASDQALEKSYPLFKAGREQMEIISALLQDVDFRKNRHVQGTYLGPWQILGFRSLNWNVIKNGVSAYILSVIEQKKPLSGADEDLLEILGSHVRSALYSSEIAVGKHDESLQKVLLSILSDRTKDYLEASRQLNECGWYRDHGYLCLVFRVSHYEQNNLPATSICNYMMEQFSGCCSFLFKDDIVNFFDLDLCNLGLGEIETLLKPFIRDSYLKAGYSRTVKGHLNIRRQYVQSILALEVGTRKRPDIWIHHFDQIVVAYMMEEITRRLPAEMLCHEGLLRLREYDTLHGTPYMETLQIYLEHHQNAVQSAKALYIHRSTFLYRMEKIREILDSDLTDSEELFYLGLSLHLLDMEAPALMNR